MSDVAMADAAEDNQASAALVGQPDRKAAKRANFKRLCDRRVSRILNAFESLKNLSNVAYYDWSEEQHEKVFSTLHASLLAAENKFLDAKKANGRSRKEKLTFEV